MLERDVKQYEIIYPLDTKPVGLCKGVRVFPRSALASLAFSACALLLGLATNVMYHTAWASLPACDLKPAVTMKNVLHATGLQMLLAQGLDVPTVPSGGGTCMRWRTPSGPWCWPR